MFVDKREREEPLGTDEINLGLPWHISFKMMPPLLQAGTVWHGPEFSVQSFEW